MYDLVRRRRLLYVAALPWLAACSRALPEPELQIVNALNAQADAWNRADLNAFMDCYWKSPDITVTCRGQTLQGWNDVSAEHRRRFPTTDHPGRLGYDEILIQPLADDAILAVGRWSLQSGADGRVGRFSRLFRRVGTRWVIAHEHTSQERSGDTRLPGARR